MLGEKPSPGWASGTAAAALLGRVRRHSLLSRIAKARWIVGLGGALALIGIWQIIGLTFGRSSHIIPAPTEVAQEVLHNFALYRHNSWITIHEATVGYIWGNAVGIILAFISVRVRPLESAAMQMGIVTYCMPIIAIGPILEIVFGGQRPQEILAGIAVVFTTLVTTLQGLESVSASVRDVIAVRGGGGRVMFRKAQLPACVPYLFVGLKIAMPAALLGAIVGEFLGANAGLGVVMVQSEQSLQVVRTWGAAAASTVVAGFGYWVVGLAGRMAAPWAKEMKLQ